MPRTPLQAARAAGVLGRARPATLAVAGDPVHPDTADGAPLVEPPELYAAPGEPVPEPDAARPTPTPRPTPPGRS